MTATADRKRVASAVTHESDFTSVSTLLPGMLVNARVKAVLKDGVSANFMTYFVGAVDAFHAGTTRLLQKTTKESQKRKSTARRSIPPRRTASASGAARASCSWTPTPSASGSRCGRTSSTTARRGVTTSTTSSLRKTRRKKVRARRTPRASCSDPETACPLGFVCAAATVRRVDKDIGALLELEDADGLKTLGYCHISDASDGHVEKLEKTFKVNARVRCRVVGRRAVDGISVVSARRSVVDQPFLSADELEPGMRVRGEVVALEPYGAMVRLAPGVKALCPRTTSRTCPAASPARRSRRARSRSSASCPWTSSDAASR